jgi:hypothetical protein
MSSDSDQPLSQRIAKAVAKPKPVKKKVEVHAPVESDESESESEQPKKKPKPAKSAASARRALLVWRALTRPHLEAPTAATEDKPPKKEEDKPKKVYEMPGQRYDTPDEVCISRGTFTHSVTDVLRLQTDSLRKFYVTLREQKPESKMAEEWLMFRGLLSEVRR